MSDFEVLPAGGMRAKYGLTGENRPIVTLDITKIPPTLRHLAPLAERFGVSDDLIREDILAHTPVEDRKAMSDVVRALNDDFDEWLAGPEADVLPFSDEYIAFTCLRIAADGG